MSHRICLDLPTGEVCFEIPVLIEPIRFGPRPEPWVDFGDIALNEAVEDIRVLAAADALIARIADTAVAGRLQELVRASLDDAAAKLPRGVRLGEAG